MCGDPEVDGRATTGAESVHAPVDAPVDVVVLGSVGVRVAGRIIEAPTPTNRALLGALALAGETGMTSATLFELVWSGRDGGTSESVVKVAIHRLRGWLTDATGPAVTIRRTSSGYAIALTTGTIDVERFGALTTNRPAEPAARRVERLGPALALWRGVPLAGVPAECVDAATIGALQTRRLRVTVEYGRALLETGRPQDAIGVFEPLAADHPLDERVIGGWIEALATCGRQADALDAYERVRLRLRDELGADPSRELGAVLARVLRQELPTGEVPRPPAAPAPATPAPGTPIPAQLPHLVTAFTGRDAELDQLTAMLAEQPTVAIVGSGGVGKTSLAVRWAHGALEDFPDGQLYVELHGFATQPAMSPADALGRLLRALGVDRDGIPDDRDEAVALYRSMLAGRRMLVVLDNASGAEQVRPLLPGAADCRTIVTSRDRLDGLVALDGAARLRLDAFSTDESVMLLGRLIGARRVEADRQAAVRLAASCDHLPLALRIAAAQLDDRMPLADHARRLSAGALDALALPGDSTAAVRAVFDLSLQRLDEPARRLFALLGPAPITDLTVHAAAALAGMTPARARRALDTLAAGHLLDEVEPGRFGCHDLVRAYAAQVATDQDGGAALHRLCDWYLATALRVRRLVDRTSPRLAPPESLGPQVPVPFQDRAGAQDWIIAEHGNLRSLLDHAATHGPYPHVWVIVDTLRRQLQFRSPPAELMATMRTVERAAQRSGDPIGRLVAQIGIGTAQLESGDMAAAREHFVRALAMSRAARHRRAEADALSWLAGCDMYLGDLDAALRSQRAAIELLRAAGDPADVAAEVSKLGILYQTQGRLDDALVCMRAAAADRVAVETGSTISEAMNLGHVLMQLGRFDEARQAINRAIEVSTANHETAPELICTMRLVECACESGDVADARARWTAGTARIQLSSYPSLELDVTAAHAVLLRAEGNHPEAERAGEVMLGLARRHRRAAEEIVALTGLSTCSRALGELPRAVTRAYQAVALAGQAGFVVLECQALTELAAAQLGRGHPDWAAGHAARAAELGGWTGHRPGEARALRVLGDASARIGDARRAGEHWRASHDIFAELGMPEAAELRARLAGDPGAPAQTA